MLNRTETDKEEKKEVTQRFLHELVYSDSLGPVFFTFLARTFSLASMKFLTHSTDGSVQITEPLFILKLKQRQRLNSQFKILKHLLF